MLILHISRSYAMRGHLSIAARRASASRPSTPAGRVLVPGRPSPGASSRRARGRGRRPPTLRVRAPPARRRGGGALGARPRPALRDGPDRLVRRVGGTRRRDARGPQDRLAARRGRARGRGTACMGRRWRRAAARLPPGRSHGRPVARGVRAGRAALERALGRGAGRALRRDPAAALDRAAGGASVPAALGMCERWADRFDAALGRVDARPGHRACGHRAVPPAPARAARAACCCAPT